MSDGPPCFAEAGGCFGSGLGAYFELEKTAIPQVAKRRCTSRIGALGDHLLWLSVYLMKVDAGEIGLFLYLRITKGMEIPSSERKFKEINLPRQRRIFPEKKCLH